MLTLAQSQMSESRYLQLMAMQERAAMSMASFEQDSSEYDSVIIRARLAREAESRLKKRRLTRF